MSVEAYCITRRDYDLAEAATLSGQFRSHIHSEHFHTGAMPQFKQFGFEVALNLVIIGLPSHTGNQF